MKVKNQWYFQPDVSSVQTSLSVLPVCSLDDLDATEYVSVVVTAA
jgi:hypothetical protein